jgi:hypothetical protein
MIAFPLCSLICSIALRISLVESFVKLVSRT